MKTTAHGCVRVLIGGTTRLVVLVVAHSVRLAGIELIVMLNLTDRVSRARTISHKTQAIRQVGSHTIKTTVVGYVMWDFGGTE